MRTQKIIIILTMILSAIMVQAQTASLQEIADVKEDRFVQFKENQTLSIPSLQSEQKGHFGLTEADELTLVNTRNRLGNTYHRVAQKHLGIKVEGAEYVFHEKNGRLTKGNGQFISNLPYNPVPSINKEQALDEALSYMGAEKYAWENNQVPYPQALLVWYDPQFSLEGSSYQLAYRLDIASIQPFDAKRIYVDAHHGAILGTMDLINHNEDVDATGEATYLGEVSFTCSLHDDDGLYHLDNSLGGGMAVYDKDGAEYDVSTSDPITHTSSDWGNTAPDGVAALWSLEKCYEVLQESFNHLSYDGNNAPLVLNINSVINGNPANAAWSNAHNQIFCGAGDGEEKTALVSLDIIVHEVTHGLTAASSGLLYSYESGALNESFSDILGAFIEKKKHPNGGNWLIGEEVMVDYSCLRNMQNPHDPTAKTQQPHTYQGDNWYFGSNDNGGVHTNSGVQNYWFYLLSEGGSGINDNDDAYDVTGIGIDDAAQIVYETIMTLTANAGYADARNVSIARAKELFGENSEQATQTQLAWCAVGLGNCETIADDHSITIIYPNGNETFDFGDEINVTYTTTGEIESVLVEVSYSCGSNYTTIYSTVPNTGNFTWEAPAVYSNLVSIKVSDVDDITTFDITDECFTIQETVCDLDATFITAESVYCQGSSYDFESPINDVSYSWTLNGTPINNNQVANITFSIAGTQIVALTINDEECTNTYTEVIEVVAQPTADFIYTGNALEVSFYPVDATTTTSYLWSFEDAQSILSTPTHTFSSEGSYEVCLTTTNECGETNSCQTIMIAENNYSNDCNASPEAIGEFDLISNGNIIEEILKVGNTIYAGGTGGLVIWDITTGTYQKITTKDGLADMTVNTLAEDLEGNIWIATSYGLNKFDPITQNIETFRAEDYFISTTAPTSAVVPNSTQAMAIDQNGLIWATGGKSLFSFDGTTFTEYDLDSDELFGEMLLENWNLKDLIVTSNNDLWIVSNPGDIIKKENGGDFILYDHDLTNINSIAELPNGNIWFGTNDGLFEFDGNNFAAVANFPEEDFVNHIVVKDENTIWVVSSGAIYRYDGTDFTTIDFNDAKSISSMVLHDEKDLWLGTGQGLLAYEEGENFEDLESLLTEDNYPSNRNANLHITPDGQVGINIAFRPVYTYENDTFIAVPAIDNSPDKFIDLAADNNHNWYVIMAHEENQDSFYLALYDGSNLTPLLDLPETDPETGYNLNFNINKQGGNLLVADENVMYVGVEEHGNDTIYQSSIWKYDVATSQFNELLDETDGLITVNDLHLEDDGTLWIADDGSGLWKYTEGGGLEHIYGEHAGRVTSTPDNHIWFFSGYGLIEYDGENFTNHQEYVDVVSGTTWEVYREIYPHPDGSVWIFTYRGMVIRYDGKGNTTYFPGSTGQPVSISDLIVDLEGNVWVSGPNTLAILEIGENGINSGFKSQLLTNPNDVQTLLILDDNTLWAGTSGSLMQWNISEETFNQLTTQDGLLDVNIQDLVQDGNGDIWMATALGLMKWNAATQTWESFNSQEYASFAYPPTDVNHITIKQNDTIWFNNGQHLYQFTDTSFNSFSLPINDVNEWLEQGNTITSMFNANGDVIWLGTNDGQIIIEMDLGWLELVNNNIGSAITTFAQRADDTIWAGTEKDGLHRRQGNEFIPVAEYPDETVKAIFVENDNQIWIAGSNDLYLFNGTTFEALNYGEEANKINEIILHPDGGLWLGTSDGVIAYQVGNTPATANALTTNSIVPSNYGGNIHYTDNGQFYLDYKADGLHSFDELTTTFISDDFYKIIASANHPSNDNLYAILDNYPEASGATSKYTLSVFDGENWTKLTDLPDSNVVEFDENLMVVNADNQVYFASTLSSNTQGIWQYNGSLSQNVTTVDSIQGMTIASNGDLWFTATNEAGVYHFSGSLDFVAIDKLSDPSTITFDANNHLWIKNEERGLFEYDSERTLNHSYSYWIYNGNYMPHQEIESILAHSDGSIWFSTFTGKLVRYNPISYMTQFIPLDSGFGIAGRITDMVEDESGNVWAMATGGLTKLFSEGGIAIAEFEVEETTCQGSILEFENTSQNAVAFEWLINDAVISDQTNLSYIFENTGTQEVTLVAYDAFGCSNSYSFAVEVSEQANLGDNEILELCQLSSATLNAGTENMAYYFWDLNGDLVGTTPEITVETSGIYTLSVIDNCGGVDTKAYEVVLSDICNNEIVLPGDINNDSVVNQYDVLFLGAAYEWMGPSRPNASIVWSFQEASSWSHVQMNGANGVHTDADGNGICDLNDAAVIQQNYGLSESDVMGIENLDVGDPLFVIEPVYDSNNNEEAVIDNENSVNVITVDLHIKGANGTNLSDLSLYGIAGSIELSSLVENTSKEIVSVEMIGFSNSCLGGGDSNIDNLYGNTFFVESTNKIGFAIVRLDKQNVSCDNNDIIAKLHVVIDDNLAIADQQEDLWQIAVTEGASITYNAGIDDLGSNFTTLAIEQEVVEVNLPKVPEDISSYTEDIPPINPIKMGPNPAHTTVTLNTGDLFKGETFVQISNTIGQILYQDSFFESQFSIDVASFRNGIYHLQIGDGNNPPIIQELMIAH